MVDVVLGNTRGLTGADGSPGADAPVITGIEKTGSAGLVDTYTITLSDGSEYTFEVTNGSDGSSVSISQVVSSGTKIATITIDGVSTDLFSPSGGSADIVTSWEQVLSDLKVPSEKLTKETIDTKISKSSRTGLITNTGDVTTLLNTLYTIIDELNEQYGEDLFTYNDDSDLIIYLFNNKIRYNASTGIVSYKVDNTYSELATLDAIPSLTNYIQKSSTTGLVKNDGTIDTTNYVSDVSGKEDSSNKVTSWSSTTSDTHYPSEKLTKDSLDGKQALLVSGTNIKTVNNESLLGSGDITITGVDVGSFTDLQTLITSASSGDTIILDKDYKYDSTTDSSLTYGITINKNITIIGNGHIIDGNNSKRAFYVDGQYTVNLSDLKIQNCNGNIGGGAIITENCNLTVTNCTFNKNTTNGDGGAIYVYGTLDMLNCTFIDNTATNYNNIYSYNAVTVYDCIILNIATSCYNVSNITTESLYDAIEGLEEDMLL